MSFLLFLIEVISALYYYISNYFFMYFETFVIKLRLNDSAKLTFVNEDVLSSLLFCYRYMSVEGKVWTYNKAFNEWSLGKLVSFVSCFPRLRLGKHQDSRENKTSCFPRNYTLSVITLVRFRSKSPTKVSTNECNALPRSLRTRMTIVKPITAGHTQLKEASERLFCPPKQRLMVTDNHIQGL